MIMDCSLAETSHRSQYTDIIHTSTNSRRFKYTTNNIGDFDSRRNAIFYFCGFFFADF